MTLIAGLGFLDETYLISDSRVSYDGQRFPEDKLVKIYTLAPNLAVTFASEHVDFTLEILRRITSFSLKNLKSKKMRFILPYIIRLARYEYDQLSKELALKSPPRMEFLYGGVVNKPQMFSSYLMHDLIKKRGGAFRVPEKIGRAMMEKTEGVWSLDPPCPILYKQLFPGDPPHPYVYLGYVAGGSGQEVFLELEKEYPKLFDWNLGMTKGIILENIIDDFIKKENIPTIGGIVQVWRINGDGVLPVCYTKKRQTKDGKEEILKELKFDKGKWFMVDHKTGEKLESDTIQPVYLNPNEKIKVKKTSWSTY